MVLWCKVWERILHKKPPRNDVIPAQAGMTSNLANFLSLAFMQELFPHFTRKNHQNFAECFLEVFCSPL